MIDIDCGPKTDIRNLRYELPMGNLTLGVFVSGGIDSALLYYILMKLNYEQGNAHSIIPYSVMRKDGSWIFAQPVVSYVSGLFNQSMTVSMVGDPQLPEGEQVRSGVLEVLNDKKNHMVYVGLIELLSIHMVNWEPAHVVEGPRFKLPLNHLNKSHIIDLVYKLGVEHLFEITHSCNSPGPRCNVCNGCNERSWGFAQIGKTDTGQV